MFFINLYHRKLGLVCDVFCIFKNLTINTINIAFNKILLTRMRVNIIINAVK